MIYALLLAVTVGAKHPSRPKPPPPPPPPAEETVDAPDEPVDPDEPDLPEDVLREEEVIAPKYTRKTTGQPELTEQQLQAIGAGSLCCCFLFAVALVAFVVWLVRRATRPAKQEAQAPPPPAQAPPHPGQAPVQQRLPFHLSVVAVGMHATARQLVAQQLILAGVQADPATAPERAQLVRELSKAVRGLETEWTHFGYGERLDLADELAAQQSYQRAVEDFGRRSAEPGSGESAYVVMTLVLCTRRQLRGVSALDDRAQIRALLEERAALAETDLMGAYIAWSSPLGGHEVLTRFPEMHAVR